MRVAVGARCEGELVGGVTRRPAVLERGLVGHGAVGEDQPVDPGGAAGDVALHVLHHAGKVACRHVGVEFAPARAFFFHVARGEDRVVVPHGTVGIDHGQPAGRRVDGGGDFVDEQVHLLGVEEQVADLAQAVEIGRIEGRTRKHAVAEGFVAVADKGVRPGQVGIPRPDRPLAVRRVAEIEVVLALVDVVVVYGLEHGVKAIVARQIEARPPPVVARTAPGVGIHEPDQVGSVAGLANPLVLQIARAGVHLIEIAVRQIARLEEAAVHFFHRQVEAPQIALVLRGGGFVALVDDTELYEVGGRRRDTCQGEDTHGERLEHSVLAPIAAVDMLHAPGEVQLVPLYRVGCAVGVPGLEAMTGQEVELPLVLARGVAERLPARAEANVVVDDAVVDQRAAPEIVAAHVTLEPLRVGDELGIGHVRVVGDEMIDRQRCHLGEVEGVDLCQCAAGRPRVDRAVPGRHAIVDEEREVRLRVLGRRGHDAAPAAVDGFDAVAQQIAMANQRRR